MHILDLPAELVACIIDFSVLARGFTRAFRLKLVCKAFRVAFDRILFPSGLLDDFASDTLFNNWHTVKYYGADKLWHDYLVFSCLKRSPGPPEIRVGEIRDTANSIVQHLATHTDEGHCRNLSFEAAIDKLCWLALYGATKYSLTEKWGSWGILVRPPPSPSLNLLSAATYFGCDALVRDILNDDHLDEGPDMSLNDLFPAPMYVAAWTGQAKILRLLQEKLPGFNDPNPTDRNMGFRSKVGPGSLEGAAASGNLDMVKLALYPPSREVPPLDAASTGADTKETGREDTTPSPELIIGERPGSITLGSKLGMYIHRSMKLARSPEVYDYLHSLLLQEDLCPFTKSRHLCDKAAAGDVVMVRHLLEIGADIHYCKTKAGGTPLMCAAAKWHEGVVDVLLEHRADPGLRHEGFCDTLLTSAARAGSMGLFCKLIDAGARIDRPREEQTLWYAIRREHTAMVEMILRAGVIKETRLRDKVRDARRKGLDSMAELVERWLPGGEAYRPEQS